MAARLPAGRDAEDGSSDCAFSMQQHDPMDRPHELRIARAPAHDLGDRQRLHRFIDSPW